MAKMKIIISDNIIEILKAKGFAETGLKNFISDKDFIVLGDSIAKVTGTAPLNINTLKRILGKYLNPENKHHNLLPQTAQIIAEYLGCDSWEQVCEYEEYLYNRWVKRGGINNDSIVVNKPNDENSKLISSLKKDDIIEVKSRPNKVLRLKFLSATTNSRWYRIIDTIGSNNLQNLDEIEIPFFRMNQPLVASQLKRKGICLGGYSAGGKQVIYSVKKIK